MMWGAAQLCMSLGISIKVSKIISLGWFLGNSWIVLSLAWLKHFGQECSGLSQSLSLSKNYKTRLDEEPTTNLHGIYIYIYIYIYEIYKTKELHTMWCDIGTP
jgi:hypothetical protein